MASAPRGEGGVYDFIQNFLHLINNICMENCRQNGKGLVYKLEKSRRHL